MIGSSAEREQIRKLGKTEARTTADKYGYSVSVVIPYYLGSKAEAAERVTPSGVLPEPVLEPTATDAGARKQGFRRRRPPLPVAPRGSRRGEACDVRR